MTTKKIMKQTNTGHYQPQEKMSDLIGGNSALLMVLSRFGITLGFGDKTVAEVCHDHHIDCHTFLTIARLTGSEQPSSEESNDFSLSALIAYLKSSHNYFLDFRLPAMRGKLAAAIGYDEHSDNPPLTVRIMRFFDDYAREVHLHMKGEEATVFPYVEALLQGKLHAGYSIADFTSHHDEIESRLTDLKNLLIKYLPEDGHSNELNQVLFDIFHGEADITSHCRIEDCLFIPAVERLERRLKGDEETERTEDEPKQTGKTEDGPENDAKLSSESGNGARQAGATSLLSQREQDIVRCVAMGLSNKEIAEKLYISVHTAITHRRNIAQKLQIHSPAGLTIYALVNQLVTIEELADVAM